jgi:hypothetical protein
MRLSTKRAESRHRPPPATDIPSSAAHGCEHPLPHKKRIKVTPCARSWPQRSLVCHSGCTRAVRRTHRHHRIRHLHDGYRGDHRCARNRDRQGRSGREHQARSIEHHGAGADAHCQALAQAAGSTKTNWRAYLSTTEPGGAAGVNARDRIGKGPWKNAKGMVVAKSVEDLHSGSNNINKQTALTEKGEIVSGRGDTVNVHDILTGSDPQGLYSTAGGDTTCGNWTKSGNDGRAMSDATFNLSASTAL